MKKLREKLCLLIILLLSVLSVVIAFIAPSSAYFTTLIDKTGTNSVMVELIFDRLDFQDTQITNAGYAQFDSQGREIPWGSKENPYVISQKYHIQNLSVLQNAGFFKDRIQTDESGNPILDENGNPIPVQSYFLVCTPKGMPVVVDCEGMSIDPIGTSALPFTGFIDGAPFAGDGTAKYKNTYGVSESTIANLKINAKEDTPDIGFFGSVGYYGTYNKNNSTLTDGYAASISNLLFADVTVSSQKSLLDTLENWWNKLFGGHTNFKEHRGETHHVGIIAGHAEFATLKSLSVYYSDNTPAFDLVSDADGSITNYYSSTGLIGLLQFVNPIVKEDGTLDGSGGISDSNLSIDGGGGGGEESGTLTGYMLAKSIFEQHEKHLKTQNLTTADVYDVKEMKKANGDPLFESVVMEERESSGAATTYRRYYFFRDTVFTFAMSSSIPTNRDGESLEQVSSGTATADYAMKLWDLNNPPSIHATESKDKLVYKSLSGNETPQPALAFKAITSAEELTAGGYYIISYYDSANDNIYLFNMSDKTGGYGFILSDDGVYNGEGSFETKYYKDNSGNKLGLEQISLTSTSSDYHEYSFRYASEQIPIQLPDQTKHFAAYHKLLPESSGSNTYLYKFYEATTTDKAQYQNNSGSLWTGALADAYLLDWKFEYQGNGKFSIYNDFVLTSRGLTESVYGWVKFYYENGAITFKYASAYGNQPSTSLNNQEANGHFTILKYTGDYVDLNPKNIVPNTEEDIIYSFDPSKYVLEYIPPDEEKGETEGSYKLAPIRSYKLNDGKGNLLTRLNHIIKLYKATDGNYRLKLGSVLDDLFGTSIFDPLNTNTGGVVGTNIGTNGKFYTIPNGMTAFDIVDASEDKPSYINVIVSVNPNQVSDGIVGLWQENDSFWSGSFNLETPDKHFKLPISKVATASSDNQYIIKISDYVTETISDGRYSYTSNKSDSYMYLGGERVFIYHKFEVTTPGIYMLGSKSGPLSIAYFSVSGAAGAGIDGMSSSPLGDIDFVYDYNGNIITVDKKFTGEQVLGGEDYTKYYPSYYFVSMLPEDPTDKINKEVIKIRRYISETDEVLTKRHFKMTGQIKAVPRPISELLSDNQDDLETS